MSEIILYHEVEYFEKIDNRYHKLHTDLCTLKKYGYPPIYNKDVNVGAYYITGRKFKEVDGKLRAVEGNLADECTKKDS